LLSLFPQPTRPAPMMDNSGMQKPRNVRGEFVAATCDVCGNGSFQYGGDGWWLCDGLADPPHPDQELVACMNGFEGLQSDSGGPPP
jgi:hypothetical protein